jgi:hypothetical protein
VISDSNIASKLGAGNAGGGFFHVKSLGMTGWKVMCSRDYDDSAPNLSECCVPFLPSVDIERGFMRKSGAGDAGVGFFV